MAAAIGGDGGVRIHVHDEENQHCSHHSSFQPPAVASWHVEYQQVREDEPGRRTINNDDSRLAILRWSIERYRDLSTVDCSCNNIASYATSTRGCHWRER